MATILIVEDRPVDRKLLATVLKSDQHHVVEAADGGEALEIVTLARPDLVISDILMPSVDGYELVRRIREAPDLSDVPVIFYTATYHAREARALATECGVAAILIKPSAPQVILDTVSKALVAGPTHQRTPGDRARFDRDHLKLVSATLAAKLDDLEAGEQRMSAIVEIAHELTAERDPSAMLTKVCNAVRDVTLAQHAVLGILGEDGRETVALYASGYDEQTLRDLRPSPLVGSALENVVRNRRPARVTSPNGVEALGLPGREPTHSLLAVPLATATRAYGWLALRNKLGADSFSDRDQDVAMTLATHAAIVFENTRLYEDERRHALALEQQVIDRERIELALRDAHERTEFALAAARTGVWEIDLITGRTTWSKTNAQLFGRSPDDTPRTPAEFFSMVHPDDQEVLRRTFDEAVAERGEFQLEFRTLWPDGSVHWQDGRARVLTEHGRAVRVLGVGIDITDRKLLEQQFRQAQKMEAIGQLAGGVAHDFNNLLTAILGNANLLQERLREADVSADEVGEIIKAGERAAGLTRQLLAFSRQQIMQPTVVDLNDLVEDMSGLLRRLIGEHVHLVTRLSSPLRAIRADQSQIGQVIMNLVVNARDAMPVGGQLTIETVNVDLDGTHATEFADVPSGRYVMLAVSDTGTGMDEATKRRLFEPFFTTKERGKGTGLGLATVYGIVKQSAGYVWVYSEIGRGTTFKIYLPVVERDEASTRKPAPVSRRASGSETILVVEDDDSVRQLTHVVLERAGYKVLVARNAQEASSTFQKHAADVDLLITDVVMPGASGPALLRHLSQRRSGLKVVYMSGYADDAVQLQGQIEPSAAFLQKPFTAEQLLRKVRDSIDR